MSDLTNNQLCVLRTLYDLTDSLGECCIPFRVIEKRTGLSRAEVQIAARELRTLGYARYLRGLMTDDGMCAGSGYGITSQGVFAMAALLDQELIIHRDGAGRQFVNGVLRSDGGKDA